jgi:amino acid adenylation domain-containing protein
MNLLPVGVDGEICIGGAGVWRGYLNCPGLTSEKFIRVPFISSMLPEHSSMTDLLYRTGDMGRYLADGNVVVAVNKDEWAGVGSSPLVAPRSEIERKIYATWSKILGEETIGVTSDFFQLGGNSIKAVKLVLEINREFNVTLMLTDIIEYMTIEKLSAYLDELSPGSSAPAAIERVDEAYNIPVAYIFKGALNREAFVNAFEMLVERHESLRTVFITVDGEPKQRIMGKEEMGFKLEAIDLRKDADREKRARVLADEDAVQVFDLGQGPLISAKLLRLEDEKYLFLLNMHHIISDGWSMGVLVREVCMLYNSAVNGVESSLLPLKIQYKDFSAWQNKILHKELLQEQEAYWIKLFSDELPVLDLPTDYSRPFFQSFEGTSKRFVLNEPETRVIKDMAKELGGTPFMVILGIYNLFLSKLSGQEDIIVGVPTAGRRDADLENIIGMFVNTLAMRNKPKGEKTIKDFLEEIKQNTLAANENQEYQFEELVDKISVRRDTARNPIFDVMFVLQSIEMPIVEIPGLRVGPYEYESKISKFDITLSGFEEGQRLFFSLEYCTKLFKKETIERFIRYFKNTASAAAKASGQKIRDIEIISEEEKKRLLYDFNDSSRVYPTRTTIHELFQQQAKKYPHTIAVVGPGHGAWGNVGKADLRSLHDRHCVSLTYQELNKKSHQLAHLLRDKGVKADTIVGIMVERSIEMIIGIMGILKAGGGYLPIDPGYPRDRIRYMLVDSGAKLFLAAPQPRVKVEAEVEKNGGQPQGLSLEIMNIKVVPSTLISTSRQAAFPTSLAYIIYTSGSTGKPKGVMVEHRSLLNILWVLSERYPFSGKDNYLLKTSVMFDVSVTELFGWLMGGGGGGLTVLEKGGEKDPQMILDTIERSRITHINFVPSMFSALVPILNAHNIKQLSSLKYIFLAGEALGPGLVTAFTSLVTHVVLENLYGPTEAAIYASGYSLQQWNGSDNIPIGKPLPNIKLDILDRYGHMQPIGIPGELWIGGVGLARGYLNRPELTAERFCLLLSLSPLYKTGDLAKWQSDGNIEFLARLDHQVKIRGNRIEMGEIENRLLKNEKIKEALVVAKDEENGVRYLCAYIVSNKEFEVSELREYLSLELPDYMIPSYFVRLEKIPLTIHGKIDRRSLPEPGFRGSGIYVGPEDEVEEKLAELWSEVLGMEKGLIGINSNFFELGGHSLKAVT